MHNHSDGIAYAFGGAFPPNGKGKVTKIRFEDEKGSVLVVEGRVRRTRASFIAKSVSAAGDRSNQTVGPRVPVDATARERYNASHQSGILNFRDIPIHLKIRHTPSDFRKKRRGDVRDIRRIRIFGIEVVSAKKASCTCLSGTFTF